MFLQKSKRSDKELYGRNDANIKVIIPATSIPINRLDNLSLQEIIPGDFVAVDIHSSNSQVLKGVPLYHTKLTEFVG